MNNTKHALMITLFFSMDQGKNHITYTSIDAILKNLAKFHDIHIKRRWVFRCLKYLIDQGFITRKPRYKKGGAGVWNQVPSMISFTRFGVYWLLGKGVTAAKTLYRTIINYLQQKDSRFPTTKEFENGYSPGKDPKEEETLKKLLAGIGTGI